MADFPDVAGRPVFPQQVFGPVVRLDGEGGSQVIVAAAKADSSLDPALLIPPVGAKGVPLEPPGYCKAVLPFTTSRPLRWLDNAFSSLFAATEAVDRTIFANGIDHITGVNAVAEPYQTHVRWGERAVATSGLVGALYYLKGMVKHTSPLSVGGMVKRIGMFWSQTWTIGVAIYLTATGLASEARKGLDLIDPGQKIFRNDTRKVARLLTYGLMFTGAAFLLNWSARTSYRSVVAPTPAPAGARALPFWFGMGAAIFYFGWDWLWTNASTQERILTSPLYEKPPTSGLYWWKGAADFQSDYFQAHTPAAHAINWALWGGAWAGLLKAQTTGVDWVFRHTVGWGSGVLPIDPAGPEAAWIRSGRWPITRGLRAVGVRLNPFSLSGTVALASKLLGHPGATSVRLNPFSQRGIFTLASTILGLPLGVGLGSLMERAQGYTSSSAASGTPSRAVLTSFVSTAGITFNTATWGYATAWGAYAWNMIPINYSWSACSRMGENLYQAARGLADDYAASDDPKERERLRTLLFNLYSIAHDNGEQDARENEKLKIAGLIREANLDVAALQQAAAIEYAKRLGAKESRVSRE